MLDATTITDEQIRDALERRLITAELAVATGAKLPAGQWYAPAETRRKARARCAEIWNARAANGGAK